jgi:hypothetical protein
VARPSRPAREVLVEGAQRRVEQEHRGRAHSEDDGIELATLLERTKMIALFLDRWTEETAIDGSTARRSAGG